MAFLSFLISVATAVVEVPLETFVPEVEEDAVVELDGSLEAVVTGAEAVVTGEPDLFATLVEEALELEAVVTGVEEVELEEGEVLVDLEEVDGELEAVLTGVVVDVEIFLRVARSDL